MRLKRYLLSETTGGGKNVPGSTVTELSPVIWWEYGINPLSKNEVELYDQIHMNLDKFKKVIGSELEMVKKHFKKFENNNEDKIQYMWAAIGTYNFLVEQNSYKAIKKVEWTGTKKSKGKRSNADIIFTYNDGNQVGISLKKSTGKHISSSPPPDSNNSINSMMSVIAGSDWQSIKKDIASSLYQEVYKKIDMPRNMFMNTLNRKKKPAVDFIDNADIDSETYQDLYLTQLYIVKSHIANIISNDKYKKNIIKYIKEELLGMNATDVPIIALSTGTSNKDFRVKWNRELLLHYIDNATKFEAKIKPKGMKPIQTMIIDIHFNNGNKIPIKIDIRTASGKSGKLKSFVDLQTRYYSVKYK